MLSDIQDNIETTIKKLFNGEEEEQEKINMYDEFKIPILYLDKPVYKLNETILDDLELQEKEEAIKPADKKEFLKAFDPSEIQLFRGENLKFNESLFKPFKTGKEIDDTLYNQYLSHYPKSGLSDLSGAAYLFEPGSMLIFNNKRLHCTSTMNGEKLGISLRFKG